MTAHTAENDAGVSMSLSKGHTAESDAADYGYADLPRGVYGVRIIPNRGPEKERCRTCGHVAIEHTPGRFSIYGTCPIPPEQPDWFTRKTHIIPPGSSDTKEAA